MAEVLISIGVAVALGVVIGTFEGILLACGIIRD